MFPIKKQFAGILVFACIFILTGCAPASAPEEDPFPEEPAVSDPGALPEEGEGEAELPLPENLPKTLADESDLDENGGYLLLGEVPEADIALYCDNAAERNYAYLRCGEHFQAFPEDVWPDPTVLPELAWNEETGELTILYYRHQGTYFDGESCSPALVHYEKIYTQEGSQWTWESWKVLYYDRFPAPALKAS